MIKRIAELKKLIEWCKANKIKQLKIGDIHFELSDLAFMPQAEQEEVLQSNIGPYNSETLADTAKGPNINEDPDLFWSSTL